MVDPIAALVIADIGTHAAKKFIDTAIDLGGKWIQAKYINQLPAASQQAEQNLGNYLNELAMRVRELEQQLENKGQPTEKIEIALQNPDIAIDYYEIAMHAARTNNPEKHYLFATLLANKLITPEESIYSLSTSSAIKAIAELNIIHLRILASMVLIDNARPLDTPIEGKNDFYLDWLSRIFGLVNPGEDFTDLHFNHLMTTSCLIPKTGSLAEDPSEGLVRRFDGFELDSCKEFLENHSTGKAINYLWRTGMIRTTLTTTGRMIGRATFEMLVKEPVKFSDWE